MTSPLASEPGQPSAPLLPFPLELLLVLFISGLVALPWLGKRDLWTSGEARVPQVARQMIQPLELNQRVCPEGPTSRRDRLIVPYIGSELRLQKPPLAYWLVAGAALLTGGDVDEFAARLPSAIAAIALSLILCLWARTLIGGAGGFMAGIAMALTLSCWWQARNSTIEMHHLLFFTAALFCWWRHLTAPVTKSRGSRLWLAGCYASLGLAILDKGPIAPLLLLLIVLIYHAVHLRNPLKLDWMGHLIGLGVLLLIAVPWVIAVVPATWVKSAVTVHYCPKWLEFLFAKGGDGLPQTHYLALAEWIKQFFGRMQGFDHIKPWYYF
ncbi:MAG: ArnT family glycosyltransferase, partial [Planctomycetota bacterium]